MPDLQTLGRLAMVLARFPDSNVPVVADVATLVLCIFSGLKALQVIHAGAGRAFEVIGAIGYAGAMYVFCRTGLQLLSRT
jgi:hypothetical protein